MVGEIVNATVSQAPITSVEVRGAEPTWYIAHVQDREPAAMPLVNGHYLFLYNLIGLRRPEKYATTLQYRYVYQSSAEEDEASWIFRYEYDREPPTGYPYAPSHIHVNASPDSYDAAKAFSDLHLPVGSRGITIEQLVRLLVIEQGLDPISPHWETILEEAQKFFDEIQRKRMKS